MNKRTAGLAGLALLILATLWLAPRFVDLSHVKPLLQRQVATALAADLDYNRLQLHVLPRLRLQMQDVSLRNRVAPFSEHPLLQAEALDFRLDLWPLLERRLQGYIYIDTPRLYVVETTAGNSISHLFATPASTERDVTKATSDDNVWLKAAGIEALRVDDATLTYLDRRQAPEQTQRITQLTIAADQLGLNRPTALRLSAAIAWQTPQANIDGVLQATARAWLGRLEPALAAVTGNVDLSGLAIDLAMGVKKARNRTLTLGGSAVFDATQAQQLRISDLTLTLAGLHYAVAGSAATSVVEIKRLDIAANHPWPATEGSTWRAQIEFAYANATARLTGPLLLEGSATQIFDNQLWQQARVAYAAKAPALNLAYEDAAATVSGSVNLASQGDVVLAAAGLLKGRAEIAAELSPLWLSWRDNSAALQGAAQLNVDAKLDLSPIGVAGGDVNAALLTDALKLTYRDENQVAVNALLPISIEYAGRLENNSPSDGRLSARATNGKIALDYPLPPTGGLEAQLLANLSANAALAGTTVVSGQAQVSLWSQSSRLQFNDAGLALTGPASVTATANIALDSGNWRSATVEWALALSETWLSVDPLLRKRQGAPLQLSSRLQATPSAARLETVDFVLGELRGRLSGEISDYEQVQARLQARLTSANLTQLADLLPAYRDLLKSGNFNAVANLRGPLAQLNKTKAQIDASAKLNSSDFILQVQVDDAAAPIAHFSLSSTLLDLDKLLAPFATSTPSEAADAEPESEWSLSEQEKAHLRPAKINGNVQVGEIRYDGRTLKNLAAEFSFRELIANLKSFRLDVFGGVLTADFKADLAQTPIAWNGRFRLNDVASQELISEFAPEHRNLLSARANFDLDLSGRGVSPATIAEFASGSGAFALSQGRFNSFSVGEAAEAEFDALVKTLSIVQAAAAGLSRAEALLRSPLLQGAGVSQSLDISAYRAGYERFQDFSLAGLLSADRSIAGTSGDIAINRGKLQINATHQGESGVYISNISAGLDGKLGGHAAYTASAKVRQKMLERSSYAHLLFDENDNLTFQLALGGVLEAPKFKFDFSPIVNGFKAKAEALVKREVEDRIAALKDQVLAGQKEALRLEAERLKRAAAAEKAKAESLAKQQAEAAKKKAAEEATRLKAEAEKKAAALKDKAAAEAKKLGDSIFKK